jgi:hypothetical protein
MTKEELRRVFHQWERQEIENNDVIDALAKYLDDKPQPLSLADAIRKARGGDAPTPKRGYA